MTKKNQVQKTLSIFDVVISTRHNVSKFIINFVWYRYNQESNIH